MPMLGLCGDPARECDETIDNDGSRPILGEKIERCSATIHSCVYDAQPCEKAFTQHTRATVQHCGCRWSAGERELEASRCGSWVLVISDVW